FYRSASCAFAVLHATGKEVEPDTFAIILGVCVRATGRRYDTRLFRDAALLVRLAPRSPVHTDAAHALYEPPAARPKGQDGEEADGASWVAPEPASAVGNRRHLFHAWLLIMLGQDLEAAAKILERVAPGSAKERMLHDLARDLHAAPSPARRKEIADALRAT